MKKLVLAFAVIAAMCISCDNTANTENNGEVKDSTNVENVTPAPAEGTEQAPVEGEVKAEDQQNAEQTEATAPEQQTEEQKEEKPAA